MIASATYLDHTPSGMPPASVASAALKPLKRRWRPWQLARLAALCDEAHALFLVELTGDLADELGASASRQHAKRVQRAYPAPGSRRTKRLRKKRRVAGELFQPHLDRAAQIVTNVYLA